MSAEITPRKRLTFAESIANRCRHYGGGPSNEVCKAGVAYDSVRNRTTTPFSLPCLKNQNCPTGCAHQSFLSPEEVAAYVAESNQRSLDTATARAAITEAAGGKRGVAGRIPCPVCAAANRTGVLGFGIARSNGHVHASCSTKGCVAWME